MATLSKKQKAAIASRKANKELLSQRRAGVRAMPLPTFDTLNSDGLITKEASKKPLTVTFDIVQFAVDHGLEPTITRLAVHMRGKGATNWGAPMYIVDFNPGSPDHQPIDAVFTRDIPAVRLVEGEHEVGYVIHEGNDQSPLLVGAPLEVDLTPPEDPRHPAAPSFPDYLASKGEITEQDVDDHPDGMVCTFPDYPSRRAGDDIEVFFSPDFSSQLSEPVDTFPVDDSLSFILPWDLIIGNKGGQNYLFCRFLDLAGNDSKDSVPARIELNLTPAPDPLEAYVPLALLPGDGLLDLQDLYDPNGVNIAIPEYDNNLPDIDVIELTIGTQPPVRFDVKLYLPFPLMLPVGRDVLLAHYGGGAGEMPMEINYFVDRNGTPTDAPTHTIDVDFSAPGPAPGEDPENSLLARVRVYGVDPTLENELTDADFNMDATIETVLWDIPLPAPGTIIKWYWGDLAHQFDELELTTEEAGDTLTRTVPWEIIRTVGNRTVPVFYTLGWDTNDNTQRSLAQDVVVAANKVVLEAPRFVKATAFLACTDLNRATREATVRVPGNTMYFREYMVVRCEFRVFSDITGDTQLGTTLPLSSPQLTPDMVSNGFDIKIPYTALRPAARNSVDFHYFVPIPGEGEQPSVRAWTRTRFTDLNGLYCEQQPPTGLEDSLVEQ
ncbi:hypothetical protein [Pseudomonas fluorescens]|uniref:hypothetical protein n=1 Tax=Pseudomonas fluorescens TaxID=294 RepID=UPI000935E3FF|nr:hypothetical protein [Pseudomonas fluorescens]